MAQQNAAFLTGSLFRHVTVMSLTASIGLVAIFLVDLVDMIFISMLGREELAAAVGYAGAILFFTTAFGIGMAIAAGSLVARALGEGNETNARERASSSMAMGVLIGAVFAAIVWCNLHLLAAFMGASGETLNLAVGYLRIIIPTLPLMVIGIMGGAVLRAHGAARQSMMATLIGGAVNAVLDPIFIFGLGLDLQGAALATVCSRVAMAVAALYPIFKDYGGLEAPSMATLRRDVGAITTIAAPAILTQFATPVGQAFVTRAMAPYGEDAVAGMAIVGRLTPVAFGVVFALSGAVGPIIGQNFGAGQQDRVRGTFRAAMQFIGIYVIGIAIVLFALRWPLASVFQATDESIARDLLFLFCGPLALIFFFNGVLFVSNAAFNNLGHPFYSTWINWGRHTLGTLPFVWIGSAWLGATGVLIGQAVGGVIFGALSVWLAMRVMRDPSDQSRDTFAREGRLLSLFLTTRR